MERLGEAIAGATVFIGGQQPAWNIIASLSNLTIRVLRLLICEEYVIEACN